MNLLISFVTLVAIGHLILCAFGAAVYGVRMLNSGAVILALLSVCWLLARLMW